MRSWWLVQRSGGVAMPENAQSPQQSHEISLESREVWTTGGFHVGYVYQRNDGWFARGASRSHNIEISGSRGTAREAAEALIEELRSLRRFDLDRP
jgi:hypothetical protein